jgi:cytochrome c peroxidase
MNCFRKKWCAIVKKMWFSTTLGVGLMLAATSIVIGQTTTNWSATQLQSIRQLWIGSLGSEPNDPTNAVANDPRAAALGHRLFFDASLSADESVSCASCHNPEMAFADNNPLAEGVGVAPRNTPSVIGSAFNQFQFWDGRSDSLWSQALGPLESAVEHGTNRVFVARRVFDQYKSAYETVFGKMPNLADKTRFSTLREAQGSVAVQLAWNKMPRSDQQEVLRVFTNVGKAIAAYERLLRPAPAPFDDFAEALLETNEADGLNAISIDAQAGLKLFIGKANCIACHSSALLNDQHFYNTGIPSNPNVEQADPGRSRGLVQLERSGFTCLSVFSDASNQCQETRAALGLNDLALLSGSNGSQNTATAIARTVSSSNSPDDQIELSTSSALFPEWLGAFKTPSLRNVARTAPYMHAGQIGTLQLVVEHYNRAPRSVLGNNQTKPLGLSTPEINQLVEFLKTLNSDVDAAAKWINSPR